MRILLDAHVSGRVVARALRARGHDVRALSDEPDLEGLDDETVLALAAREGRVLVTHDVKDFPPLLRRWAEAGRSHAGCVLVHGLGHRAFGPVLTGLDRLFAQHPTQEEWVDLALFLTAATGRD